ncbi:hypothetical protein BFR45_04055 [Brochothrix thermosphacta]|uniref:hypothetical protein n=1 Tax=Brochothrix thermosphacta TaxID=2756 RepID=UPI00083F50BB|nr:hypothetical protein [Brochothrix thermosphacta]ODJ68503.1 hypothetical protein BFR45_04055 [Brochothrix thermosphacta]
MRIKQIDKCKNYSKKQKRLVNKLKPWNGSFWDNKEVKDLKKELRIYMLKMQDGRCAYCGNEFGVTSNSEIEHIAAKGGNNRLIYPQFTFTPYNLVLACHLCNSPVKKGQIKVINRLSINYKSCDFDIIHPYFDNPSDHLLEMIDSDDKGLIYAYRSVKGLNTLKMFSLNNEVQIKHRTMEAIYSEISPENKEKMLAAYMYKI